MNAIRGIRLARETRILLVICAVDIALTVWLVTTRRGTEGNPIMSYYLHSGWGALLSAKLVLVAMPIFIAEWALRYRPRFVRRALQFAIVVYLAAYAVAFVNGAVMAR